MTADNSNASCCILPGYRVQHWDCSDYADGVVTDGLTGKIIERRK